MPGDSESDIEFVSQNEIDRLLSQEAESSAEDAASDETMSAVGETASPKKETPSDVDASDDPIEGGRSDGVNSKNDVTDKLLEAEPDTHESAGDTPIDRVILEEVPGAPAPKASRRKPLWALQRDFWITLSAVCILGTGLNLLLWIHKKRSLQVIEPRVLSFPVVDAAADTAPVTFRDNPRVITLKSFLVPAPIRRKDLTYITADVSVELTHAKAVSLIKAHAAFYRNIIYEEIKRVLSSLDKSKINEISLKIEILKALNGSVPERSVGDVSVDALVMF